MDEIPREYKSKMLDPTEEEQKKWNKLTEEMQKVTATDHCPACGTGPETFWHHEKGCRVAELESALQSAREQLDVHIDILKQTQQERDTLKAEATRMREAFGNLLRSHSYFTQREYESDTTYNASSIGYKAEEKAINVLRDIYGEQALSDLFIIPAAPEKAETYNRPKIVTLCGSTRFMEQFFNSGWDETMKGNIVLSVGVNLKMETPDGGHVGEAMGLEVKEMLDELHKRKIDLSDEVLVLNVGGYIGESTRSEINHAIKNGVPVRYLEPIAEGGEG